MSDPEMRQQWWIVKFEDASVSDALFQEKTEAMEFYRKAIISWNCHLFCDYKEVEAQSAELTRQDQANRDAIISALGMNAANLVDWPWAKVTERVRQQNEDRRDLRFNKLPELTRKLEDLTPILSNAIRERNKYDAECDRLEATVEELHIKLAAMTEDRDLWAKDHSDDCPYKDRVEEQSLIRELGNKLQSINRILSPGHRTMDDLLRDTGYACDVARCAIAMLPKDTVTPKL